MLSLWLDPWKAHDGVKIGDDILRSPAWRTGFLLYVISCSQVARLFARIEDGFWDLEVG